MKILCYKNKQDYNFESMVSILQKTKYKVGYLSGEIKNKEVQQFNPDVIIHNIAEAKVFPIENNGISININETDSDNSFSLLDSNSKNFIPPFVVDKSYYVDPKNIRKFESEVVYIGSPFVFDKNLISFLCNSDIHFKFFDHNLVNINGYCGICHPSDYLKFYKYSKCSLVKKADAKRIMDIVISDGNPVLCDDYSEAIEKIQNSILKNEKYKIDGFSKEDIIENHTVFDRMSNIFKHVGLTQVAKEIIKIKSDWIKK